MEESFEPSDAHNRIDRLANKFNQFDRVLGRLMIGAGAVLDLSGMAEVCFQNNQGWIEIAEGTAGMVVGYAISRLPDIQKAYLTKMNQWLGLDKRDEF